MKCKYVVCGAWGVGLVAGLMFTVPASAQTSLSIYKDGRVVVRRTLPQALQRGRNAVTLNIDGLDPATLFSPDSGVTVMSAVARFPSTDEQALSAAVGQTIAFGREKDTVRATVVRVDPPQVRLGDGRLVLDWPGTPIFPAAVIRTSPSADVVLEARTNRPRTELAFVGAGMTWEAVYQVVLGRASASVTGSATVTSAAMRADSVDVQLVAGSIRRTRAGPPEAPSRLFRRQAQQAIGVEGAEDGEMGEAAVGETHVYSLPGRLTLEPGVPVTTALFPRSTAPVTQELVVPGAIPWRGYYGQMGTEPQPVPVQVWYTLKRARGSALGDRPLPGGTVQLYQADSAGRVQLVGEASISHTAPGRDLRVQSGDAFDITAERVQTDYRQEQLPPPQRGVPGRTRVTASLRVTLTNAKAEAVSVDVRETHMGEWRVTESSVPAEKLSSSEVRFRVSVPANGTATLTYTVQIDS